jgi:hypothetical protein
MHKYVFIACLFASGAFAQDSPWQYTGGILLSEGGDRLFTGKYTDGTKIDITAGGTLALNFGLYRNIGSAFDLQTTLGIHTAGTLGTNGNASFTRFPLEVMGFYQLNDQFRLGAGARKSLAAKLSTSGVATYQPSLEFNASVGQVIELQYLLGKSNKKSTAKTAVNFRYVKETFTEKTEGIKVKGDHIGVGVVFYN